jgi:acetolactate synthase I/II/III large subunit
MRKDSQIVLECLRAEGVDVVFGYPGGAIMPLYDVLDGSGVRHILTRHEQGAVFAAEG